jgi:methylated-DNA-protein-cysteine methyltransferase related protein
LVECDLAKVDVAGSNPVSRSIHRRMKGRTPAEHSRLLKKRIANSGGRPDEVRDDAFRRVIRSIPKGYVATYGQVAAAAGYPLYHRAVARLLRTTPIPDLPWQRVLGSGGEIKLPGKAGAEQRLRLKMEGVTFRGPRVDMAAHHYEFRVWELD